MFTNFLSSPQATRSKCNGFRHLSLATCWPTLNKFLSVAVFFQPLVSAGYGSFPWISSGLCPIAARPVYRPPVPTLLLLRSWCSDLGKNSNDKCLFKSLRRRPALFHPSELEFPVAFRSALLTFRWEFTSVSATTCELKWSRRSPPPVLEHTQRKIAVLTCVACGDEASS